MESADRLTRTTVRGGRAAVPASRPRPVTAGSRTRRWTPPGPLHLGVTLGPLRRGPGDPTFRVTPDGSVWRASCTPAGPGTLRVARSGETIEAEAWGPGGGWLLDGLPALLGAEDDPEGFTPRHRIVHEAHRRNPGLRLTRTGLVLESLIPSILEQKVTADEAYRAWRLLVRQYGPPAPGPADRMHTPPDPRTWARIPSWDWHKAGVDGKRSAAIVRAAKVFHRMEEAATMDAERAASRLCAVDGIGPWTAAETLQRSNGAPDAVTVGDLHLPKIIGYALTGVRDTDDARMLDLLTPYEGHRHRATRLILLSGHTPPRRAPRLSVNDIRGL
ncbi:DNA-3-methyladenine glycosylase family protein [Streptomyces syringium]|uniref:3-methyladenine DNA glycosylase/8-oxoguanine DNA glycosylase n=1 Tax=Streptomyces syringium TaxID=76729 RepID=A0ABS4Y5L4_9ACTN|nr:DNA-3-methyladenine glycosylase 2 family protein [Streptomyces syringium]MBP2403213.1 3-methyladenine DNA glycosylase/8-oxoguanine DNA glycosylase [Streptomyces syringium]